MFKCEPARGMQECNAAQSVLWGVCLHGRVYTRVYWSGRKHYCVLPVL